MVIAIDEVGDFAHYSERYNFMIAALLSRHDNGMAVKQSQFDSWKNTIDSIKFTNQNEVKGTELSEDELFRFTNEVIISNPIVGNVQIRVKPSENPKKVLDQFKIIELNLIKLVIGQCNETGDINGSEFFNKLSRWLKDRNYQHYMKMALLESCISRSVEKAIGASIVDWLTGDDINLMNLEIKIDKDFINKDGEKKFFKELLGQAFRRITEDHPIPMVRELMDAHHPFAQTFLLPNNMINLGSVFNNRCDFFHSHYNFELQIADILGTIFHRAQNRNSCKNSVQLIDQILGRRGQIKTHLVLNPNPNTEVRIEYEK